MFRTILVAACLYSGFILQPVIADEALDPELLFADAMKYRQNGELFKSIEIFETLLQNQPELNRARLELAVSYHLTRRYEDAKTQLLTVLNDPGTPDAVKLSVTAYLAQLSVDVSTAATRSSSSLFFSAGLFTDSNINLGPGQSVIEINKINPSSAEKSGNGGQLMLSYSNRSRASQPLLFATSTVDFEWLTQATLFSKVHTSGDSDFNLSVVTLNTGPALIADRSWRSAFNIKLDKLFFGNERYAEYAGINPVFTYSISSDLEITIENHTTAREYDKPEDQGLRGTMTSWGVDLSKFYFNQSIGIHAGTKYHDNGATSASLHYTGAEFYLGVQMPAWTDAHAYLTLSTRDYRYKAADSEHNYTIKRDETEQIAMLGLSHDFRRGFLKSWTLNAQTVYTDNQSNIEPFSYDRLVLEMNIRRYFF